MIKLYLHEYPKFLEDIDRKLRESNMEGCKYQTLCDRITAWYGITPVVNQIGTSAYESAYVEVLEKDATMFMLKWL
jgi:hypothetical protein